MNAISIRIVAVTAALIVSGCGGGGGGGDTGGGTTTPPPGVTTYPLLKGYTALVNAASTSTFNVSGSCTGGTGTIVVTTPVVVPPPFEGISGNIFSKSSTQTLNLSGCTPSSLNGVSVGNSLTYYDNTTFSPVVVSITGVEYDKYSRAPSQVPTAAAVGDAGDFSALTRYSDPTKATVIGQQVMSYTVVVDGASTTTAIVNFITKSYDAAAPANLLLTEQDQYRIDTAGNLTLLNIDLQYSTTSTTHLLLTKN